MFFHRVTATIFFIVIQGSLTQQGCLDSELQVSFGLCIPSTETIDYSKTSSLASYKLVLETEPMLAQPMFYTLSHLPIPRLALYLTLHAQDNIIASVYMERDVII